MFVHLAVLMLLFCASPAYADPVIIQNDRGGNIEKYIEKYEQLAKSGERIIIDGTCFSACTLVLGIFSRDNLCITARANFGFHASTVIEGGIYRSSPQGTARVWNLYPSNIKAWLAEKNGGLSHKVIYLRGPELQRMYPACDFKHPPL